MSASEVRTAVFKTFCNYRSSDTTDDIDLVATAAAAGSSVATGINHPPPTNLGYHTDDPEKHL